MHESNLRFWHVTAQTVRLIPMHRIKRVRARNERFSYDILFCFKNQVIAALSWLPLRDPPGSRMRQEG